jgi:hypothetical protein
MIFDISHRYSLKKCTRSSGENFSEIVVNHSISEKKIAILLFSHSKFTFHAPDNISVAISFETYSHSALLSFCLCLFSIIYFIIFDETRDKNSAKISSVGKFIIRFVE